MALFIGKRTTNGPAPVGILVDGTQHSEAVDSLLQSVQGGTSNERTTTPTVADSGSSNAIPTLKASLIALVLFVPALAIAAGMFGSGSGPSFTAAQGIGAFALFYVAAQAAERAVEVLMPICERIVEWCNGSPKSDREKHRNAAFARAVNDPEGSFSIEGVAKPKAEDAAEKQGQVDQARADRTLISFAATAALGMLLCSYLSADFLSAVGVDFSPKSDANPGYGTRLIMMLVTGLALGGGAKGLHDSISNISKSSDQKSTPATGA